MPETKTIAITFCDTNTKKLVSKEFTDTVSAQALAANLFNARTGFILAFETDIDTKRRRLHEAISELADHFLQGDYSVSMLDYLPRRKP